MINEDIIEELKCAISDAEHFLIEPIALACGHSVCLKCITEEDFTEITCKICNLLSAQDLSKSKVSRGIQEAVKMYTNEIFKILENETVIKLNQLKDDIKEVDESLDVALNYIEEKINVRVESLKIEVEEVGNKLKARVQKMRKDLFNSNERDIKLNDLDLALKELQENIKNKLNLSEYHLDSYQNKMLELDKLIAEINAIQIPHLKVSTDKICEENIIVTLVYVNSNKNFDLKDSLKIENKEYFNLDHHPYTAEVLSNDILIIANYLDEEAIDHITNITVHDKNLTCIRTIEKINGEAFHVDGFAVNQEKGELFILEILKRRIIVTDFELNFIKYFGSPNEFRKPRGICFKGGYLYVSDRGNNQIAKFDQNLEYVKEFETSCVPGQIKATNSLLFFFKRGGGMVIHETDNDMTCFVMGCVDLIISEIDSNVFCFDWKRKNMHCYNNSIFKSTTIKLNEDSLRSRLDGTLVLFNKSLLMISYLDKKLIKFQ